MEDFKETFIKNLKEYRKEKGLSQEQLAEICHCSTPTIGGIETKQQSPSFEMLIRLAEALNINPADFFIKDASHFSEKESFSDNYKIAHELNTLPEIPKKAILNMISEMKADYSANSNN